MEIYFEAGGNYITAADERGKKVAIRCNFEFTDCGNQENLDNFVERHGGPEATVAYLKDCYREATRA